MEDYDDQQETAREVKAVATSTTTRPLCGKISGNNHINCNPDDSLPEDYSKYLLVLILFILALALVMCLARILLLYCGYKRRRFDRSEDREASPRRTETTEEATGHPFSYLATEAGRVNYGFVDPPPRYDQLFKDDSERVVAISSAPPTYEDYHATTVSARSNASTTDSAARIPVSTISATVPTETVQHQSTSNTPIDIESPHASNMRRTQQQQTCDPAVRIPQGAFGTSIPNFSLANDRSRAESLPPAYEDVSLNDESSTEEEAQRQRQQTSERRHRRRSRH